MGNPVNTLTCAAPAKLNLFLHVLGRRADGYHLLHTLFCFIDFGDTLHFALREDGVVRRVNILDGVPPEQDLCVRAARLLQSECSCKLGVDITLEKRIPLGGGLGGGSSDAATTLLALNQLWNLRLSRERLMQLGLTLGADVPVFVFGENALAQGVGEELQAYAVPQAWYVVLFPPVHVATTTVFAQWDSAHPQLIQPPELTADAISLRIRGLSAALKNDLQAIACSLYPEVAQHLAWLDQFGLAQFGQARMTGSGGCVFIELADSEQAHAVLEQLPRDMRGIVACGLPHHPLRDLALRDLSAT